AHVGDRAEQSAEAGEQRIGVGRGVGGRRRAGEMRRVGLAGRPVPGHEADAPHFAGSSSSADTSADTDPLLTRLGALLGTVAYMSPEQARGEPVGPASDLFSLGLILHEAISTTPPFPAESSRPDVLARLADGRIDPPTEVDADVAELLARICHPDPARRGETRQLRDDLRSIREAPARWLRKVWRRSLAAATVFVLLLAAGVALEARWRAQTEAASIECFAREAAEVVWRLRATELAPRHDVGPTRATLRGDLERLEASLEPIDGTVAVAGHRSIGRAWLALGDLEAARRHLEAAAEDAPDDPETAWWLGRVYAERYRRALDATAAIGRASVRERAIETARATWRRPAIAALRRGRDATEADPAWLEAWIAGHEERFDDARAVLTRVVDRPWSIDAALLAGDLDHREGDVGPRRRDELDAYDRLLQRSAGHYRRATAIGRSSPAAHGRLCGILAERARLAGHQRWREVPDDEITAMWQACDAAMDIDEAAGVARLANARAWHAEAELATARGDDPAPAYRRGIALLDDAASDETDATDRLLMRGSLGTLVANHLVWTGAPSDEAEAMIEQAVDDLTTVWQARSADPPTAQMIGNTRTVQAFAAIYRGDDPMPTIEAALPILESTLARHPDVPSLHTVHGNLLLVAGRERFSDGEPAVELLEAAVAAQRRGGQHARANVALVLGDLALAQDREGIDPRPALREAITISDELLADDPDHAIAYGYRGLARFYLGAYQLRLFDDPTDAIDAAIDDHERELALGSGNADSALTTIAIRLWATRWRLAQGQPQTAELTAIDERLDAWDATHGAHFDLPQHRAHVAIQQGLSAWIEGRDPRPAWRTAREHVRQGFAERPDHGPLLDRAISLGIAEARYAIERGEDPAPSLDRLRADLDAGFEGSSPRNVALATTIVLALEGEIESARVAFARVRADNPTAVGQLRLMAPELVSRLVD
ncbi:MAG: protein kinase, partial [Acidobacteriota bacterium]